MAQDDTSSNNNEQLVKSEAFAKVKPEAQAQDGSAKAFAEVKAQTVANPEDMQVRDLLAKIEQPLQGAISPERGGTGHRYGMDGKLHEAAEKPSIKADQVIEPKPPVAGQLDEKHLSMARAYVEKTPQQAVAEYPELAKVYVARAAAETQLVGRPPESQQIVMARFDERAISQIEQGKLPAVQINEKVSRAVTAEREHQLNT